MLFQRKLSTALFIGGAVMLACSGSRSALASIIVTDPTVIVDLIHESAESESGACEFPVIVVPDSRDHADMSPHAAESIGGSHTPAAIFSTDKSADVLQSWLFVVERPVSERIMSWRLFRPPRETC